MRQINLLLIDDHEIIREGLRALAARTPGWQVIGEAEDGIEGVRLALSLQPDVVIVDMMLPGANGLEVARRLRAAGFSGRVLMLSAHMGDDLAAEARAAGVDDVVHKHRSFSALRTAVEHAGQRVAAHAPVVSEQRSEIARVASLTPREREVLLRLASGAPPKTVAAELGISVKTLDVHRHRLVTKLEANGVADLTRIAVRSGLISL
jgi:DNA-binding NarL/FixJ family response regulator